MCLASRRKSCPIIRWETGKQLLRKPPRTTTKDNHRGQPMTRRELLQKMSLGYATLALPLSGRLLSDYSTAQSLTFGVIADVHQDIMHDGVQRLAAFTTEMNRQQTDFIMQLGDFCVPKAENDAFMDAWNAFNGPRYHVIGNHDTDGGFSREQVVEYYAMPSRYYSFDQQGIHVVVLDGNDKGGVATGYASYIAQDQLEWLKQDLSETDLPTMVFIHQPLDNPSGIDNRLEVRLILEHANTQAGWHKVFAVFAGHAHVDYARQLNGIYYILINSASYQWVGGNYEHQSYPPDIHEKAPTIKYTCPYKDPLWATVKIDLAHDVLIIRGKESKWVGPAPEELGADFENEYWGWNPRFSMPRISDWQAPIPLQPGDLDR